MGAAEKIEIYGAKGGEDKPKTPTEAPDSLRSISIAKMLIAIGEGEFEGAPTARDIYLDNTPLQDPQGNMNFPNVKWEWRSGAVDQNHIQGIPSVENETTIGAELRSGTPWVRSITNTQLSAIRVRFAWPAIQSVDASGNINGYRIEYKVELAIDGGAYQQVLSEAVDGKKASTYERTRRIDLPKATSGWLMRITRLTANQNNNKISDTMQIAGFTEVIDAKIRYPNTALLYIEFSAEQFRSIPAVTVGCKSRKWPVPSNYDPETRTYAGIWDGTFKEAYTNNPSWVTRGITINDRFGLGRRIKSWMVDKWELYRISQYCDQLVPNGKGGMEPRFICDLSLQSKADAWSLLRDISAIYRGMTYWAQGQVFTLSDMPRATDFDFAYTRANVIDGKFTYSSASERTRYTRALISYDNPLNNYDTDVTAVTDPKLQRRYGDNALEVSAIGCTRESEAQRRGKWVLLTNSKDRAVVFRVGLDGRIPLPGYVVPIADELLAGRAVGGRISAVSGRVITLDRDTQAKTGDRLILNLPDGKCEGRTVQLVSGRKVTVTTAYSVQPERELVWALDADDLAIPLYRVVSVARPEAGVFEISAVQYDPSKFAHIDTGARLEERPISVIPITVVPSPASVSLTSTTAIAQGLAVTTMTISWPTVTGAVSYDVEWRRDNGNWIRVQRTGSTSVDITGIYAGAYLARVRAVSAYDISSSWRNSILTQLKGKEGLPPAVTSLTAASLIFGIKLKWTFPQGVEDTQRTEIWYGPTNDRAKATKLSDLAYPQSEHVMQGLLPGVTFFFWARLVDRTGNIGPWYPTGVGVMGQTSSDAGPILQLIADQISETELAKHLLDRIDLIDGDGVGSVNERLDELKAEIGDITDALVYVPTDAYVRDNTVRVGDNLWTAIAAVPAAANGSNGPPNPTYWVNTGQSIRSANAQAAQVSKNTADITTVDGKTSATASQLQAVQAQYRADSGEGDLLDALKGWDSTASAAQEVKIRAEEDFAQAQRTTTLQARVGTNEARITTVETTTATDREATSQRLTAIDSRVGNSESKITTIESTANTDRQATTQQISTLTATVNTNQSSTQAAIQTEATARSDGDTALGRRVDTVQATADNAKAAVQTVSQAQASTDGKLNTMWSVKMQVAANGQYIAAGIGLGIENTGAGLQSQFLVSADRFAVVNSMAGGAISVPFAVQNGQVFINSAFIQDGTITNAKIGSFISSTDYVAGQRGWILRKDGTLEINGSGAGGGRLVVTNRSVRVYDANNVKRVQLGDLSE
ncbi:phage tail protein [Pseudomonas coronafaciens]|uniref:phage tail protein n=1 Tax=Pseudomonas coronafaciens TaxID=53409 RepID=UPI000EFE1F7C|nr:DUF1983 domain-containing protein [Pseudomonas coronafaciens]